MIKANNSEAPLVDFSETLPRLREHTHRSVLSLEKLKSIYKYISM